MERTYRNVNHAFYGLVMEIQDGLIKTRREETRNGPVIQIDEPAMITYTQPTERVLFNEQRDCNPFFHVFEAMWMLAGRNDVAPLAYYTPAIANYSDDGQTFNGAYGYRWRQSHIRKNLSPYHGMDGLTESQRNSLSSNSSNGIWGSKDIDQLDVIVDHLKEKPNSRRVNLQMWNVEDDLLKIDNGKDVCCNTNVYFSMRQVHGATKDYPGKVLDMTVCNRSNDLVWGMLGANVVHFSFLQEYLACRLGVEVGRYTQFSNNLHVHTENNSGFLPEKWLKDGIQDLYTQTAAINMKHVPLVRDPVMFDREVKEFVDYNSTYQSIDNRKDYAEPFLTLVAQPMMCAFHHHKAREYPSALAACGDIQATDWRVAAQTWVKKRRANWEAKQVKAGE